MGKKSLKNNSGEMWWRRERRGLLLGVLRVMVIQSVAQLITADQDLTMATDLRVDQSNSTNLTSSESDPVDALDCTSQADCQSCLAVKDSRCYFCLRNESFGCFLYPAQQVFPSSAQCSLSEVRWAACWLNFMYVIIGLCVVAGLLLTTTIVCCYYCCRKGKTSKTATLETQKWDREADQRQHRFDERKAVRDAQIGAIRQKYGLNQSPSAIDQAKQGPQFTTTARPK